MSQIETETVTNLVRQTRNVANKKGRLVQKATRFLRPKERKQREEEKAGIDGVLNAPPWVNKDLTERGRAQMQSRRRALEDDLEENTPPRVSGGTKDALAVRLRELEENIRGGMPTVEVMRRNPPGAVDMHDRWSKRTKDMQIERKNILKVLDPDNEDKDYCSVEMLRPSGVTQEMAATFMMNSQIPGNFAMTPLAKANWPAGMPEYGTVNSPMKQAEAREADEPANSSSLTAQLAELEAENRKLKDQLVSKAEARVALQRQTKENREKQRVRMKEYWANKKAAQRGEAAQG
jgi:hypothetical protein